MGIAEDFRGFLSNLAVDNAEQISLRYGEITAALNKEFRDTDSKTANSLQVGSYGRGTAIKGISDLDMLYFVPKRCWDDYRVGGQSRLLTRTKEAIKARYPQTEVYVDRLVIRVLYKDFHIEVQPVFEQDDGSFKYPDTYSGGSWKITKPRDEIRAMSEFNAEKNDNLRRLCKMIRAWKNKHGVGMGGLLIDTLAHNFLKCTAAFDDKSYLYYDWMSRDFFEYIADLPAQEYHAALGSGQRVKVKSKFQTAAKNAHKLCLDAIEETDEGKRRDRWRKVFGNAYPISDKRGVTSIAIEKFEYSSTEQFVEDLYPIDIRFSIEINCDVSQNGFREYRLREFLRGRLPLQVQKGLRFYVEGHDVPGNFDLYWKVLNRGGEAKRRNCVRGQIFRDTGRLTISERTDFAGDHVVECYAVKCGVVVAKNRIHVPIAGRVSA
ncbi:SMODS domain-containing nucleotidyltransferase [Cupriavidus alkaliphilus]|uniref:SMODS domain-containing nucleotidyltransferase n=1 Tax=Cupriavidus alkaliphilus TaxID=942866 RepID=UPI001620F7F3|nr:nucleotidyltransferase [Cupriavidus alkaliphilus]MBB2915704.1 hypothetical protein [Cupriavidus alkaliphilus]